MSGTVVYAYQGWNFSPIDVLVFGRAAIEELLSGSTSFTLEGLRERTLARVVAKMLLRGPYKGWGFQPGARLIIQLKTASYEVVSPDGDTVQCKREDLPGGF